jgi:hypothetical protein
VKARRDDVLSDRHPVGYHIAPLKMAPHPNENRWHSAICIAFVNALHFAVMHNCDVFHQHANW